MKAGIGSARKDLGNGIIVSALSVVNAVGNIINRDGTILAGNRDEKKKFKTFDDTSLFVTESNSNTTITIVGINIDLKTRENYERVAHIASHGQIRAINPVNMSIDGDTVFVFSTEEIKTPLNEVGSEFQTSDWPDFTVDLIGQTAAQVVQNSIYNACFEAESIQFKEAYNGVIPSVKDF
jgi:L-aminopeptidase/D-esterase-like protein